MTRGIRSNYFEILTETFQAHMPSLVKFHPITQEEFGDRQTDDEQIYSISTKYTGCKQCDFDTILPRNVKSEWYYCAKDTTVNATIVL